MLGTEPRHHGRLAMLDWQRPSHSARATTAAAVPENLFLSDLPTSAAAAWEILMPLYNA